MTIKFPEIYTKAIGLFDDPKITVAFDTNKIQFYKLMYTFLQNSISMFNNPSIIGFKLANFKEPFGQMQVFIADGVNNEYELDDDFIILEGSELEYVEQGNIVRGILDKENRTITFPNILNEKEEYSFEQYYVGEFLDELNDISSSPQAEQNIINQTKDILARLLIKSWAESTRNFLLDIQNILTDHDFKIHPASQVLKSKNEWIKQLDLEILQYQNKLSWVLKFATTSDWGRKK